MARGAVDDDPVLREIGAEHGKSAVQVALRWLVQQPRVMALPKATSPEHPRANLEIFDLELSNDEMARIAALDQNLRLVDDADVDRER